MPSDITGTPGINFNESSLGVDSVWMNIDRAVGITLRWSRSTDGLRHSLRRGFTRPAARDRRSTFVDAVAKVDSCRKSTEEEEIPLEDKVPVIVIHCRGLTFEASRAKFRSEGETIAEDMLEWAKFNV